MINYISVDGFKSLIKFEISLNEGLNILVGPNGSGKTNIISFMEFLGHLQEMTASDAISNAGGAGAVLTKVGENKYRENMTCCVAGNIQLSKRRVIYYRYMFEIGIYESAESIGYRSQRLMIKHRTVITKAGVLPNGIDLDIEMTISEENNAPSIKIHSFNRQKIQPRFRYPISRYIRTTDDAEDALPEAIIDIVGTEDSLLHGLRIFLERWHYFTADIRGGKIFNIVPSRVRIAEDSAKPPGIAKDGSGLYATLHAIKQQEHQQRPRHRMMHLRTPSSFIARTTLDKILKYTRLANDSINKIDVFNDPFDNQLQIRIWIQGENESTVLPLSAMSDGTIKWLSLITIILTTRTIFSIEEPENYLHPLMQAEILSVMRSSMRQNSFILLSTHSETILNNATPEEIIVVSFRGGVTTAKKADNSEALSREIKETGFGLGYYYIAGSLDDV